MQCFKVKFPARLHHLDFRVGVPRRYYALRKARDVCEATKCLDALVFRCPRAEFVVDAINLCTCDVATFQSGVA